MAAPASLPALPPDPLKRCGSLICRECGAHSPTAHGAACLSRRYDPCGSRWFWLTMHGATKCVACAAPVALATVEAWVLARESGEGADGWQVPAEVMELLGSRCAPVSFN